MVAISLLIENCIWTVGPDSSSHATPYLRERRLTAAFLMMDWQSGTLWSCEFRLHPLTGKAFFLPIYSSKGIFSAPSMSCWNVTARKLSRTMRTRSAVRRFRLARAIPSASAVNSTRPSVTEMSSKPRRFSSPLRTLSRPNRQGAHSLYGLFVMMRFVLSRKKRWEASLLPTGDHFTLYDSNEGVPFSHPMAAIDHSCHPCGDKLH